MIKKLLFEKTAVLALGELRSTSSIRAIINLLNDKSDEVREVAAYTLHELTGQDFGYDYKANSTDRVKSIDKWNNWWNTNGANFTIQKRTFVISDESTIDFWDRIKKEEEAKKEAEQKDIQEIKQIDKQLSGDIDKKDSDEKS